MSKVRNQNLKQIIFFKQPNWTFLSLEDIRWCYEFITSFHKYLEVPTIYHACSKPVRAVNQRTILMKLTCFSTGSDQVWFPVRKFQA